MTLLLPLVLPAPAWRVLRFWLFSLAAWSLSAAPDPANEWKDPKGATFKGEPIETAGPVALFRTGGTSSKFLPLRALSPDDCVRFQRAIATRAPRASSWSQAKGEATAELLGRVVRLENREARPLDFDALPEPEFIVGIFIGRREGNVSHLLDNLGPFVTRVQRVYPGQVVTVVVPTRQANMESRWLPARPWLFGDPGKLSGSKLMARFAPAEGMVAVLMTREGVPLFGRGVNEIIDVTKFVDGASDFLWELNPANPRAARDRAHYLRAVRPVEFADQVTGPLLVIDPLRIEPLRARGVTRITAKLDVGADGEVTAVEVAAGDGMPAPLVRPVAEALRRNAFFLPAIERGAAVAGRYAYELVIPPLDALLAADSAWVKGEARVDVPIKSWLVLKSVKVPEQVFSTIDRVGEDGTVMLSAVTAGSAGKVSTASQKNAFNSDWFTAAGADSVRPVAGEKQEIDGEKLTWKKMNPYYGLVDFLGNANNLDYCIGYAWTEVEVPADTDGWLGIGSDDGLKVWVNGELVDDKWQARTSRLDDEVVPVRLKRGANRILIKIQNVKGLWSFTCRLRVRGP